MINPLNLYIILGFAVLGIVLVILSLSFQKPDPNKHIGGLNRLQFVAGHFLILSAALATRTLPDFIHNIPGHKNSIPLLFLMPALGLLLAIACLIVHISRLYNTTQSYWSLLLLLLPATSLTIGALLPVEGTVYRPATITLPLVLAFLPYWLYASYILCTPTDFIRMRKIDNTAIAGYSLSILAGIGIAFTFNSLKSQPQQTVVQDDWPPENPNFNYNPWHTENLNDELTVSWPLSIEPAVIARPNTRTWHAENGDFSMYVHREPYNMVSDYALLSGSDWSDRIARLFNFRAQTRTYVIHRAFPINSDCTYCKARAQLASDHSKLIGRLCWHTDTTFWTVFVTLPGTQADENLSVIFNSIHSIADQDASTQADSNRQTLDHHVQEIFDFLQQHYRQNTKTTP